MNEKKKPTWLTIAGLIALIIVLCLCVELIFMFLGRRYPSRVRPARVECPRPWSRCRRRAKQRRVPASVPSAGRG